MPFHAKIVRAVRPRICTLCRRTINPGDRYIRTVETDDFNTFRITKTCMFHDSEGKPTTMGTIEQAEAMYGPAPEGDEDQHNLGGVTDPGDSPIYDSMDES